MRMSGLELARVESNHPQLAIHKQDNDLRLPFGLAVRLRGDVECSPFSPHVVATRVPSSALGPGGARRTAMQLIACPRPLEALLPAPLSALCDQADVSRWAGFWSLDGEVYYARLNTGGGEASWFRLEDSPRGTFESAQRDALTPVRTQSGLRESSAASAGAFMVLRSRSSARKRDAGTVMVGHRRPS
jgi:hypothetical protein